jgi:hypothetical protein
VILKTNANAIFIAKAGSLPTNREPLDIYLCQPPVGMLAISCILPISWKEELEFGQTTSSRFNIPNGSPEFSRPRACHGWHSEHRQGVPVNFTEAAECFHRAADGRNGDGENSLAVCLDLGCGLEQDCEQSSFDYRQEAPQHHPIGINNFERSLEYEQTIEQDFVRARDIIDSQQNGPIPTLSTIFGFDWNEILMQKRILTLPRNTIENQLKPAIGIDQTISESILITGVASNKISNCRPCIANGLWI